jgi:hypothetical protein
MDKNVTMVESNSLAPDSTNQDQVVQPPALWSDTVKSMSTTAVVLGATLILLSILHPNLILTNNTPTGGDMGAHVWGPAYLRDVLLPHWRLTGWSMDWYAGLPAYRFYMVIPALAIVALDVVLPYGIAFKLIVVSGLLAFPWCAYFMGKITKLPYPLPELMVIGALFFLLDESFTIYGGNIASTMAGEFSHSIALAFSLLGLGLFSRGLDDGKYRGWAALCIALSALSHGIVLLFVFGGAVLMMLLRLDRQRLRYGIVTLGCAVLLSAFWVVPFLGGHAFMTDMKYGSEPGGGSFSSLWEMYFPLSTTWDVLLVLFALAGFVGSFIRRRHLGIWMGVYIVVLMLAVKVAQNGLPIIGLLWNPRVLPFMFLLRYMLAAIGVYEVLTYLFRLIAAERGRASSLSFVKSVSWGSTVLWIFAVFSLVVIGVRYQALPGGKLVADSGGTSYAWGPVKFPAQRAFSDGWARWNFEGYEGKTSYGEYYGIVQTMKQLGENPQHGCGRALWENNSDLNKYGTTMALMLLPYWTDSCIGSMEGLYFEAAGTTPYHFLAAAALSKQSSNPVRELRYVNNDASIGVEHMQMLGIRYFMAYTPEAIAQAVAQDELTLVATSGPWQVFELNSINLVEPLTTQPVVVNKRDGDARERWLEIGTSYFQNSDEWAVLPVADGPDTWQRVNAQADVDRQVGREGEPGRQVEVVVPDANITSVPLDVVTVSNVEMKNESISFSVDKVGIPVLVRVSYFPNWQVSGAQSVIRAAPNMMVVIPTEENVTLSYQPSTLDNSSYLLTFAGIVLLIVMMRRRLRYGGSMPPYISATDNQSTSDASTADNLKD